jgi:quercetin dioxygenase-like cupin family protein
MEIRRFGPGHRRPEGPPGTQGVSGQVIFDEERALVSELAFGRFAMISPHSNPNTTLFIVVSGGGYVQVGDERTRISHGEAVIWPAGVPAGLYTDGSEMRAIVVELPHADGGTHVLEGSATQLEGGGAEDAPLTPADGQLAERRPSREEYDSGEGEPW